MITGAMLFIFGFVVGVLLMGWLEAEEDAVLEAKLKEATEEHKNRLKHKAPACFGTYTPGQLVAERDCYNCPSEIRCSSTTIIEGERKNGRSQK